MPLLIWAFKGLGLRKGLGSRVKKWSSMVSGNRGTSPNTLILSIVVWKSPLSLLWVTQSLCNESLLVPAHVERRTRSQHNLTSWIGTLHPCWPSAFFSYSASPNAGVCHHQRPSSYFEAPSSSFRMKKPKP